MATRKDIHFEIKGIKEVTKILSELPSKISDRVILDINKSAGRIVQKEIQSAAPEGDSDKKSKDTIAQNIIVKKSNTRTGVLIGFTRKVWYVRLLEYGTKVRKLLGRGKYRSGANRGTMTRKPFIEKAHLNAYPKAVDHFVNNYLKIVNRSLKRLAKRYK